MALSIVRISELVIEQLSGREMRLLSLVVAIRKGLDATASIKGDLTTSVKSALRTLVATKIVIDHEGLYSLAAKPSAVA